MVSIKAMMALAFPLFFFLENGAQWPVSTMVIVLLLLMLFGQVGFRSNNKDVCRKRSAFVNRMDESEDMEEGMEYTKQIKKFPRQKKFLGTTCPSSGIKKLKSVDCSNKERTICRP